MEHTDKPQSEQLIAGVADAADRGHPAASFAATRFVLVEPSHPGNVGAAARALKTMGFQHLLLVRPRAHDVLRDSEAIAMASGANDVLASARIVASLEEALVGVEWSLALSARPREYGPPVMMPRLAAAQAALTAREARGAVALVFGNERAGLSVAAQSCRYQPTQPTRRLTLRKPCR